MGAEPLTIRPRCGTRAFRKHASLSVKDGTIVATDRRGRSRKFPLAGAENSPTCFGRALAEGRALSWLEDRNGRALLLFDSYDWGDDLLNFKQATGLFLATSPRELDSKDTNHSLFQPPPKRPDAFVLMDPNYVSWAIRASAIGGAVISLRWLHFAPEFLVYVVALPALVFLLWCLLMNKLAQPSAEQQAEDLRRLDDDLRWIDEDLMAAGEEPIDTGAEPERRKKRGRKRR